MKSIDIVIDTNNADKGKKFRITRMSAWDAAIFTERAIAGMANAGVDIMEEIRKSPSVAALADFTMMQLVRVERHEREELGNQLLGCCKLVYNQNGDAREIFKEDIQEALTIFKLKFEALSLMLSHFVSGSGSGST